MHAANDTLRNELVPINQRYPIAELMQHVAPISLANIRAVLPGSTSLDGVNDSEADARQLVRLLRDIPPK